MVFVVILTNMTYCSLLCVAQTQSFMNALSNCTVTVDRVKWSAFACWHSGELYEWSGILMEP